MTARDGRENRVTKFDVSDVLSGFKSDIWKHFDVQK